MSSPAPDEPRAPGAPQPPVVHLSMARVVGVGMIVWLVALAVTLLVPDLHRDTRSWWPWCCLAGVGLGALGLAYLGRGRGNAAAS